MAPAVTISVRSAVAFVNAYSDVSFCSTAALSWPLVKKQTPISKMLTGLEILRFSMGTSILEMRSQLLRSGFSWSNGQGSIHLPLLPYKQCVLLSLRSYCDP